MSTNQQIQIKIMNVDICLVYLMNHGHKLMIANSISFMLTEKISRYKLKDYVNTYSFFFTQFLYFFSNHTN